MSITSRITKPWLSWLGLAALVIGGLALVAAIICPMFSRAGQSSLASIAMDVSPGSAPVERMSARTVAKRMEGPAETSGAGVAWAASMSRMVIYTAEVSIETNSIEKQHREIARIAREAGGFLTSSGLDSSSGVRSGEVTVRVPQQKYAATLDAICKLGRLLSKREEGQDVTEEFVDLQSRMRNLKREEEAFLKVLGKAVRVTDILAVESELSRVRGEIETAEGRIKYLQNQTDLATITVRLSEPRPAVTSLVRWDLLNTGKGAAHSLSGVFRGITTLIIWLVVFIPLWALIGVVVYGVRRYRRRIDAGKG
jgi:hypothetical protein